MKSLEEQLNAKADEALAHKIAGATGAIRRLEEELGIPHGFRRTRLESRGSISMAEVATIIGQDLFATLRDDYREKYREDFLKRVENAGALAG